MNVLIFNNNFQLRLTVTSVIDYIIVTKHTHVGSLPFARHGCGRKWIVFYIHGKWPRHNSPRGKFGL